MKKVFRFLLFQGDVHMEITKKIAESIVTDIGSAINQHVNMMDRTGSIIASTDPKRIGSHHHGARCIVEQNLENLIVHSDREFPGARVGINLPITFQDEIIGVIGVTGNWDEIGKYQKLIRKTAEMLLSDAYKKEHKSYSQEQVSEYLRQWLFGNRQQLPSNFLSEGIDIGIDTSKFWRIGVFSLNLGRNDGLSEEVPSPIHLAEEMILRLPSIIGQVLAFNYHSNIILVLPDTSNENLQIYSKQLLTTLERKSKYTGIIGFDDESASGFSLRDNFHKANLALWAARFSRAWNCRFYKDVLLEIVLNGVSLNLRRDYLDKLFFGISHEEVRQWLDVLEVFYKHKGSIVKSADQLFIHKNTLQYKLKKIAIKTGYDPRDIGNAARFQIAIAFARER